MAVKYPWTRIKREYVEATSEHARPTLDQLATKYKCNQAYLRARAGKEDWTSEASIYLTKIQQDVRSREPGLLEEKINSLASEQAKFDMDCLRLTRALQQQIGRHIGLLQQADADDRTLRSLAQTLEIIQRVGRIALDDDTQYVTHLISKGYLIVEPGQQLKDAALVQRSIAPETIHMIREEIYGIVM